jgi:sugar-phosphatase
VTEPPRPQSVGRAQAASGDVGPADRGLQIIATGVDAVLFDLDGTLVDSGASIARSWRRWGEAVGLGDAFVFTGHGRPASDVVAELIDGTPKEIEDAIALVAQLEIADAVTVRPYSGAVELVAAIPNDRRALVTSSTRALGDARARAAGLPRFSVVLTADDVTNGKPDPEGFLAAARLLGVSRARCVVVEDSPAGLEAARRAGMARVGVATTRPAWELDAVFVASSVAALDVRFQGGGLDLVQRGPGPVRALGQGECNRSSHHRLA